ncbi:MAG: LysR family transcriptional regulator, low CO2-responsive transcriptional regulator [Solirubrobacteraceae bacterium]|nr:LysR family transcriptional regulator, low CO2-responsive transcriptional regulator [Solirubrobacteraceae bacterium]
MTLGQLRSFATVARLGSVKAAAKELGVSEPAVSEAVKALRRDLGDELFVRRSGGIALTAGGERLAGAAAEILGIADQARRAVREAHGEAVLLRVATTATVSEHVVAPLIDAFCRRTPHVEVSVEVEAAGAFADMIGNRRADVALGPRPAAESALGLESVPFLRYRLNVVAARGHRLAGVSDVAASALAGERWLVGPSGADPAKTVGAFLAAHRVAPQAVHTYASEAAALAAVEAGHGIALAVAQTVVDQLRRGDLVRLDVRGTPLQGLWHATCLPPDRRTAAAWALMRFVTTPEAVQAMLTGSTGVPAGRFRAATYVTLWS